MFVDSHTHLDEFNPAAIPSILNRAHKAGIRLIITVGTTVEPCKEVVRLINGHPMLYGGVGLHPMDLKGFPTEEDYSLLRTLVTSNRKIITISEIGLDFTDTSPPRDLQEQVFREQLRMALQLKLPIVFHCRNAYKEIIKILKEEGAGRYGGIFHYFQGDLSIANAAIDLGFYISIAKPILSLPELQSTVGMIPLSSMVLETDCAPQPWKKHRKNWTEPYHIIDIATKLAEIKNTEIGEVESTTTANILSLFNEQLQGIAVKPA